MRRLPALLFLICLILISCGGERDNERKVISLNIRYDNPADAPNDWPSRKDFIVSFLQEEFPSVFGLQEALWHQYAYIDSCLTGYESVAAGRDDGIRKGEMTPVFYRSDLLKQLNSGTFWLSETPEIPGSKGWGAVLPRIVTWVQLEEKQTGKTFYFFNTHYSHMSDSARLMSSEIILNKVKEIAGGSSFMLAGDFNMRPGSKAYATLTGNGSEDALIIDSYAVSETGPAGLDYTFNGFRDEEGEGRIDYIFVSPDIRVLSHNTPGPKSENLFLSDHWPVVVKVKLD
ncbi:MAG: endonuclease/exonuclease/phosphatase family protein [Bacteroidales bacterium]